MLAWQKLPSFESFSCLLLACYSRCTLGTRHMNTHTHIIIASSRPSTKNTSENEVKNNMRRKWTKTTLFFRYFHFLLLLCHAIKILAGLSHIFLCISLSLSLPCTPSKYIKIYDDEPAFIGPNEIYFIFLSLQMFIFIISLSVGSDSMSNYKISTTFSRRKNIALMLTHTHMWRRRYRLNWINIKAYKQADVHEERRKKFFECLCFIDENNLQNLANYERKQIIQFWLGNFRWCGVISRKVIERIQ